MGVSLPRAPASGDDPTAEITSAIAAHNADTTSVHGISLTDRLADYAVTGDHYINSTHPDFGATGDNVTNDAPALQAALNSITAGTVVVPPGTYRCESKLTIPPKVSLLGASREGCVIYFTTGLAAGDYAIDKGSTDGVVNNNFIANLDIRGPGYGQPLTYGTALTDINGVKIGRRTVIRECNIRGFYRGVAIKEDHCWVDLSTIVNNHFNIAWIASGGRDGDQVLSRLDLNGTTMASVYVEDGTRITDGLWLEVHMGNGPYGILSSPGRATTTFLVNMDFIQVGAENFGTAFIRGQNTTDAITDCEFTGTGALQSNTYKPGGDTYNYVVECGSFTRCVFDGRTFFPSNPPALAWIYGSASGSSISGLHIKMMPSSGGLSAAGAGKPIIKAGSSTAQPGNSWSNHYGSGVFVYANDALADGEVAKIAGDRTCAKYGIADTIASAGIARHACSIGDHVALGTSGGMGTATVNDGGVSVGSFLKPSTTTAGRVMATTGNEANILGVNKVARTDGQTITSAEVRLAAWRV